MIKVANIIEEGRFGGPQNRIVQVAKRLKKLDIKTTVVFPDEESDIFKNELKAEGVPFERIGMHRLTREKLHLLKYLFLFPFEVLKLRKIIKKGNFDIVHCNGSYQLKGVIAGRLAGKKVIWHLNDSYQPRIVKFLFNKFAKYVDAFISASGRTEEYYLGKERKEKKSVIIQSPVDISYFDPEKTEPDKKLKKLDTINIVTIASINPIKKVEDFIEAARLVNEKAENVSFVVVGPFLKNQKKYNNMLVSLKKKYGLDNLIFYGKSKETREILKASDIYVCTSQAEASPSSVWEAMAMEKGVVSTNVGDVSRFVENNENGLIVPVGDIKKISDSIIKFVNNYMLREKFGKKCRAVAKKNLDLSICVEKHAKIYKELKA